MTDPIDAVRALLSAAEEISLSDEMRAQMGNPPIEGESDGEAEEGAAEADEAPPYDVPPYVGDPGGEYPMAARCLNFPLNDIGNGQRFGVYFGDDVLLVPNVGWFIWSGMVWEKDPDDIEVRKKAQQISALILEEVQFVRLSDGHMQAIERERDLLQRRDELEAVLDENGKRPAEVDSELREIRFSLSELTDLKKTLAGLRRERRSFAKASGNSPKIHSLLTETAVHRARKLPELDAEPLDVNTRAGVLRFSVDPDGGGSVPRRIAFCDLLPHDRSQLLTKIIKVDYDPEARAPLFTAFLDRIMPDPEMRGFLKRWFGYSMTALTGEQKLVFLYGAGANGKSVLVDVIARILGDYAATAKIESITGRNKRGGGDATPDLVPLIGARLVRASEPDEGERFQEGLIKELTGGEPILVRALQKDFVEVKPQFKLTISGNHKPDIRGTDDGIWRRLLLVPFDVQIPKEERDGQLVEKLLLEAPGILNWLRDGLIDYLEGGLREPQQILDATQDYREESDPVGAFLEACCLVTGSAEDSIGARELGQAFNFWLEDSGNGSWKDRTVALKLREKADRWRSPTTGEKFAPRKSSTMSYDGIRLNDVFADRWRKVPRDQSTGRPLMGRSHEEGEA